MYYIKLLSPLAKVIIYTSNFYEHSITLIQMKRLPFLILAATLLLSQIGTLDHLYSEHQSDDVCDYCLSVPSHGNALTNAVKTDFSNNATQQYNELAQATHFVSSPRYYATRAPPRLI